MVKTSVWVVALSAGLLASSFGKTTIETLHSFPVTGTDGTKPVATLTVGPDGNLYGTTTEGGAHSAGTVFKVELSGTVTVLDDFEVTTTGANPLARLVNVGDGFLYGVTSENGDIAGDPDGTVYKLDPAGELSPLFQLKVPGTYPRNPRSLAAAEVGFLHVLGYEPGGLWRVPLDGSPGTVVRNFNSSDRANEGSFHEKIIRGSDGFLYGVSKEGGANGSGMIFRVARDGTGFTRLHSCETATGIEPVGAMVEGPDGNFYGTMSDGGKIKDRSVNGVIYRITPAGDYNVIHHFGDFRYPEGDLMIASDGYLYGTAQLSGPGGNGNGGIFRIKRDGSNYRPLFTFEDASSGPLYPQGRTPLGGLVQGADGYLYGTTHRGGEDDMGTVFRLKLNLPPPPVNRPPVAVDDYVVSNGEPVSVQVTPNDFDPDNDSLVVSVETQPDFGTAVAQPDGSILYTPVTYTDSDAFLYKVSDQRGGTSVATVTIRNVQQAPLVVAGSYNGLLRISDENTPTGRFVLTVRENGKFTGTLFAKKKRVPLKGTFDENGADFLTVNIPTEGKKVIFLHFQAGTPNTVKAVLFSQDVWFGEAGPTLTATSQPTTSYTVQISSDLGSDPLMPVGYGYGVVRIKPSGTVSMKGKLSDGTNLSWSSTLTQFPDGTAIPIFAEPVKGGVFAGIAEDNNANGFGGIARWVRPLTKKGPYASGFNGTAALEIAPFIKPQATEPVLDLSDGTVTLFDGPITSPISGTFTIDGKRISVDSKLRKLKIDRNSGLFSGTMVDAGKTFTFKGAINQEDKDGVGYVSVKGRTGKVELFREIE